jgi:deoxycytidylate deaminase
MIQTENFEIKDKCAKQTTVAIIANGGKHWISTNYCDNAQPACPRGNLPTGVGYEMCKDICQQRNHAEMNVCRAAGEGARGGTLFLIGHYYCCESCRQAMEKYGIKKIVVVH